jgi:DNA-3-methyladenine glycosylase
MAMPRRGRETGGGGKEAIDFLQSPVVVARALIGWTVLVDGVGGVIVETEAYDMDDEASHCYVGLTARNAVMFGPPGHAYVYLSYGLHWCLNFVCRAEGHGAGVLIRALEPTHGIDRMIERRGTTALRLLASGPGRVGQALGIDRSFGGLALDAPPFQLLPPSGETDVAAGTRIGISKAIDLPWRFVAAGSRFLSKPIPRENAS